MQTIIIAGNVGKDAATKDVNSNSVTEWSVAVSSGRNSDSTWYKCSLWGERGKKVAGYIRKGDKITVAGRLTVGVYDGKPDLKIDVSEVTLQGGKQDGGERQERAPSGNGGTPSRRPAAFDDDLNDDIPFVRAIGREPGASRRVL